MFCNPKRRNVKTKTDVNRANETNTKRIKVLQVSHKKLRMQDGEKVTKWPKTILGRRNNTKS
jgi:hypothetical protein